MVKMKPETIERRAAARAAEQAAARLTIDEAGRLAGLSDNVKLTNWSLVCRVCEDHVNLLSATRSQSMAFLAKHDEPHKEV